MSALRGNIFDLKKLHHLKIVNNTNTLVSNKYYWMVYSPKGLLLTNWKTKVKVQDIIESKTNVMVLVECSIMEDNYTFNYIYDSNDYTFFEYDNTVNE
jgi:hypothetical protein